MSCKCNKVRYDDKKSAETALNALHSHHRKEAPKRCYPCPNSKYWHLTSDKHEKGTRITSP